MDPPESWHWNAWGDEIGQKSWHSGFQRRSKTKKKLDYALFKSPNIRNIFNLASCLKADRLQTF